MKQQDCHKCHSQEQEEEREQVVTTIQSLSLNELQEIGKDFSCHSGEYIITAWLL